MALGLSFGTNKTKTNQTSTVDKTETTNQVQDGTKSSTGTTSTTGSTSQTGTTTGSQQQSSTTDTKQTGTTTGQTSQSSSLFSDPVLSSLEDAVQALLGQTMGGVKTTVGDFDPMSFVQNGLAAARSTAEGDLASQINQTISATGGSTSNNSMAALLANRLRTDTASQLAGVEANLNSQAQSIVRDNTLAANTIDATQQGFIANLLSALKGGTATQTGTEAQQTATSGSQQNTGATATSEQSSQQQNTQSTQTTQMLEIIQQLLSGTTRTQGTETTTGTTSKSGGGLSLSL